MKVSCQQCQINDNCPGFDDCEWLLARDRVIESAKMFFSQPYDNGQHEQRLKEDVRYLQKLEKVSRK